MELCLVGFSLRTQPPKPSGSRAGSLFPDLRLHPRNAAKAALLTLPLADVRDLYSQLVYYSLRG